MTYSEFVDWIKVNNINLQEVAEHLGYSKISILNNWSKKKEVPKKAEVAFQLYLENKKLKELNNDPIKAEATINLPLKALEIAKEKCLKYDLGLEEYLSSLVISNI